MCDLWWTRWHWDNCSPSTSVSLHHYHLTNSLYSFLCLQCYVILETESVIKQHTLRRVQKFHTHVHKKKLNTCFPECTAIGCRDLRIIVILILSMLTLI